MVGSIVPDILTVDTLLAVLYLTYVWGFRGQPFIMRRAIWQLEVYVRGRTLTHVWTTARAGVQRLKCSFNYPEHKIINSRCQF